MGANYARGEETPQRALAALAARQHGNVTRRQLVSLGVRDVTIGLWVTLGWLHRIHRGVYAVGRPPAVPLERAAAAVLACGPHAALSHRSAMVLWGIWKRWESPLHVTLASGDRRPDGITVHRSRTLTRREITTQLGIRVTTPARTALDIAPTITRRSLTRAVNDARHANILTLDQLDDAIARNPTHPGGKLLQPFLETSGNPTRSPFEDAFATFCAEYDLPEPVTNQTVCGYEVDALFPAQKVIVECDGWDTHKTRTAFETDRERDATTLAAGYVTVRITKRRLEATPASEAARLSAILAYRSTTK